MRGFVYLLNSQWRLALAAGAMFVAANGLYAPTAMAVTPLTASVSAEVEVTVVGFPISNTDGNSWGTPLSTLQAKAQVIESGVGAGNTEVGASWSSASNGGFQINTDGMLEYPVCCSAIYNSASFAHDWRYSFIVGEDSIFRLNYSVLSNGASGEGGFRIYLDDIFQSSLFDTSGGNSGFLEFNLLSGNAYSVGVDNYSGFSTTRGSGIPYELAGLFNFSIRPADAVGPSVPEPATWLMMIFGFGLTGGAMRYRRRREPKVRFAF